jgi:hypothetical protein
MTGMCPDSMRICELVYSSEVGGVATRTGLLEMARRTRCFCIHTMHPADPVWRRVEEVFVGHGEGGVGCCSSALCSPACSPSPGAFAGLGTYMLLRCTNPSHFSGRCTVGPQLAAPPIAAVAPLGHWRADGDLTPWTPHG